MPPRRLVVIGLGVQADAPAVDIQPPLPDGVHLRWGFRRELGFPWSGYYLFRRPSREGRPRCLAREEPFDPEEDLGTRLVLPLGTLDSDVSMRRTDDFPDDTVPEIDLAGGRSFLRFTVPGGDSALRVDVRIGFREGFDAWRSCLDLGRLAEGLAVNSVRRQGFGIVVRGAERRGGDRTLRPLRVRAGPELWTGLDAGRECHLELDAPAAEVTVRLVRGGDEEVRAVAFDPSGDVLDGARVAGGRADGPELLQLRAREGAAIARVELFTADAGETALLEVCRGDRRDGAGDILAVGRADGVTLASAVMRAEPGGVVDARLVADGLEEVTFEPLDGDRLPDAALVDLCYVPTRADERGGWEPLPDCPQPLTLPLFHPDYPATGSQPEDQSAAEQLGLDRVLYGDPGDYAGDPFAQLHESLVRLVEGGPDQGTMADPSRARDLPGVPTQPDGAAPPKLARLHPLDLVLLAAVHPAAAQMTGLAWVDRTAEPGQRYDYLVVADGRLDEPQDPMKVLGAFFAGELAVDGAIAWGKRVAPAPPLPPPDGARAYSLPLGVTVAPGGPGQPAVPTAGLVGLLWELPMQAGVLVPESAVTYHLWRAALGNADQPEPSADLGDWITKAGPVLIATPLTNPFSVPQRPPDWPPFRLHRIERVADEGWYGFRVAGMDLFGRISEPTPPMPWRQWAPEPQPRPWYYADPPSDAVVHPDAVLVLDKTPPPAPVGVEASALDPGDPFVIRDAAYHGWRAALPAAVRDTLVGLRVRWRWTAAQMRQAPDTAEFRVYFNEGTAPPAPDVRVASSWEQRVHVVPFDAAAAVSADGSERIYDVLLPGPGAVALAGGVPLTPTLIDPIAYAHVGVSAADAAAHTADDPRWSGQPLGDRPGNEGLLGGPAKIFRVRRERPAPPAPPADAERVFASPADYHARSYYTFRWRPRPGLKTHVFRAMDASVFAADRARRPRPALGAGDAAAFPDPAAEPRWDAAKRAQVAAELNGLNAFPQTSEGEVAARAAYRALSNDGLRVLAGLPGTEAAFTQLTVAPLDPADPASANRLGPDNPAGFPVDPALRAYVDVLDGRGTSRWFYRAAYVDAAHNRSALSLSGPPIWLPNVVPPRAPVPTSVVGGEREITVSWASNREPDLVAYRVYRADEAAAARDVRAMTLVHTEAVAAGDPDARPAVVSWVDAGVPALVDLAYAIVAVDDAGNASEPSPVLRARAYDTALPDVPALTAAWTAAAPPAAARLRWTAPVETRVERRADLDLFWVPMGDWRPPGAHDETLLADPSLSWRFRLRARKPTGALKIGPTVALDHL
jgi:hypothetical protein